jgi:uncharacterized coiled-coil DUF342 family protein
MVAKPHDIGRYHVARFGCSTNSDIGQPKINTKRLEDSVDKIDAKIDVVQSEIRKEIRDAREELRGEIQGVRGEIADVREMNQQIGSVREELSKLNQNHIDHLTCHEEITQ